MGTAVTITRTEHLAAELRAMAANAVMALRSAGFWRLRWFWRAVPRTEAAAQNGMDRQTLRDWVHRYNQAGIEGLKSRRSPGPTPVLSRHRWRN